MGHEADVEVSRFVALAVFGGVVHEFGENLDGLGAYVGRAQVDGAAGLAPGRGGIRGIAVRGKIAQCYDLAYARAF